MKEKIMASVQMQLISNFTREQLNMIDDAVRIALFDYDLVEKETALSTSKDTNEYMLKLFSATKKLQGCADATIKQYVRHNFNFLNAVGKSYSEITKDDVKIYLAMESKKVSPNSLINTKWYLGSFYTWLHDEGYIPKNPVKAVKGIKPVTVKNSCLSIEEEITIRDLNLDKKDRAIIDLCLSTGLRVGEIVRLNRSDVDWSDGSITIISEKSYIERTVFLDARAKRHLAEYLDTRNDDDEALFLNSRGTRMHEPAFEKLARRVGSEAGITNRQLTIHVFRKTFATRCADNGMPLEIIQTLLGHSSADVTSKTYVKKSKKRIKNAFDTVMFA